MQDKNYVEQFDNLIEEKLNNKQWSEKIASCVITKHKRNRNFKIGFVGSLLCVIIFVFSFSFVQFYNHNQDNYSSPYSELTAFLFDGDYVDNDVLDILE